MHLLSNYCLAAGLVAAVAFSPLTLAGPEGAPGSAGSRSAPSPAAPTEGALQQVPAPEQLRNAQRIQSLEQQIQPRPEQQSAWSAFRNAQGTYQKNVTQSRHETPGIEVTSLAQLEKQVLATEQDLANLKALVKATGELYSILDPDQKKVLDDFFTKQSARTKGSDAPRASDRGGRSRRQISPPAPLSPAQ